MNPVLLSRSDEFGAGRAAYRLHRGLQEIGVDSNMLVQKKISGDNNVIGIEGNLTRKLLKLPQDKQLVLFGASSATSDRCKGFHLLQPALQSLSQSGWHDKIELVVFASSRPSNPPDLGFNCRYLGRLGDDISLALVYAAADLFVAPSVQDNLPNTVVEAIACGTPCVAFKIGAPIRNVP
ncbi:MAG: glycosyltransferase [Oscillatoria sp. SIO1A7]|nr:glycosyltransferase [Oscillatoria sp. SIO1A7]